LVATYNNETYLAVQEDRTVAIVAPQWLQDGLAVVIKSIPHLQLVACTGSINTLLLIDLERSPDLVVLTLDIPDTRDNHPIRQIKFVYPQARCLALIQEVEQSASAHAAGADETLLQGVSAEQFCLTVRRLVFRDPLSN
jgi:DNA-binding NarL/FixJ family response regulator